MKDVILAGKFGFAGLGGWLGAVLGGMDGFLYALIVFVVIDYITGVMCAVLDKKVSSFIGARGIFKKVLIFAMVGIGHVLDTNLLGDTSALRTAVVFFYIANEGISILENTVCIGLPVPQKLKDVLENIKGKGDKTDES